MGLEETALAHLPLEVHVSGVSNGGWVSVVQCATAVFAALATGILAYMQYRVNAGMKEIAAEQIQFCNGSRIAGIGDSRKLA